MGKSALTSSGSVHHEHKILAIRPKISGLFGPRELLGNIILKWMLWQLA